MKKVIFKGILFLSFPLLAQVGIGTKNPQEQLHVGGTNSTIRVDGLNSENNATNSGIENHPVFVDKDGNLVLEGKSTYGIIYDDYIVDAKTIDTKSGGKENIEDIYVHTFTLTEPAIVVVNYDVPFLMTTLTGGPISDGQLKVFTTYVSHEFNNEMKNYAYQSKLFSTLSPDVSGIFHNSSSIMIELPVGKHTIKLKGWVMSAAGSSIGNPFRVQISDNFSGYLKIQAIYRH